MVRRRDNLAGYMAALLPITTHGVAAGMANFASHAGLSCRALQARRVGFVHEVGPLVFGFVPPPVTGIEKISARAVRVRDVGIVDWMCVIVEGITLGTPGEFCSPSAGSTALAGCLASVLLERVDIAGRARIGVV
jgi:hypothetical protein